jgi:flagella basal body P-ring formation protein FlgA
MKFSWTIFVLLLGALTISNPVNAGEITGLVLEIPDAVVIPGPKITLADISNIREANIDDIQFLQGIGLGMAPTPGCNRIFTRNYLEFILRQHQHQRSIRLHMGEKVEVRVEAFHIKGSELAMAIEKLLPPKPPRVTRQWVEYPSLPKELWLAKGDWKMEAVAVGPIPELGKALFRLKLKCGAREKVLNISAVIKKTAMVYRISRNIPAFTPLNPADFEKTEAPLKSGKEYIGAFPAEHRAVRILRRGRVLENEVIQPLPLVQKGTEVKVLARGGGVEIALNAVAKNDGWRGDQITLINPGSKKEFQGRVYGKSIVEVAIE